MKTLLLHFTALTVLFTACSQKKQTEKSGAQPSEDKIAAFEVDSVVAADSVMVADSVTASFKMTTLVFPTILNKTILDSIYAGQNIKTKSFSKIELQGALDSLKNNYFRETKESLTDFMPGFAQEWTQNSSMKVFSHKDDILTLTYLSDGYTGGAHGYYNEMYRVFDLKSGRQITLNDVISNQDAQVWSRILMTQFLQEDLDRGQAEMLLVKDIPLNNNFYFDNANLYFLYNQYEIAAYAAGPVLIKVPFSEIKPFLQPKFRTRINLK